jgi:hypothetical protein
MAAAVPWIIMGGTSLVSSYLASRKSKEEKAAQSGQAANLRQLTEQGAQNFGAGFPAMQSSLKYYSTLLNGNRAAQQQAIAAPTAQLTDVFRGAERNLDRQGVRGGSRDLAVAELGRDRANQIGQLTTGVQPMAAANMGQLGSALVGAASGPLQAAAGGYGQMNAAALQNRQYSNQVWGQSANNMGTMAFDIWKNKQAGKSTGPMGPQ